MNFILHISSKCGHGGGVKKYENFADIVPMKLFLSCLPAHTQACASKRIGSRKPLLQELLGMILGHCKFGHQVTAKLVLRRRYCPVTFLDNHCE